MKCKDRYCADYDIKRMQCSKSLEGHCPYANHKSDYASVPIDSTNSPYKMVGMHSETAILKKRKPIMLLLPGPKDLLRNRNKKNANGKHRRFR